MADKKDYTILEHKKHKKLMALASVAKMAGVDYNRVVRWFYGQTGLEAWELESLEARFLEAEMRATNLASRARREKDILLTNKK